MPTKKIVLSNDAALLVILENSFFRREGFDLVVVRDGQTGLQAVEAEEPSLAVLDLSRLGDQALECCRAIKKDPLLAKTPVLLVLPENADDDLADGCWKADCDAVVHRPLLADPFLDVAFGLLGISRRLAKRFPVSFQLEFHKAGRKKHLGSCVNLNDGGMFMATESLFPVDTLLAVEFNLPGFQIPLSCNMRVAWVNHPEWLKKNSMPCGLGLEFTTISPTIKAALQEFLDDLEPADALESVC